jgi:L,D-peptidoglycan transpeptidase YkuD (ErfK/YbiS/YcfS/YnhG family)
MALRVFPHPVFGTALDWGAGAKRCAVGHGGIGTKMREGDNITPVGTYPLRRILYRADRITKPRAHLPLRKIAYDDGWCDAPNDAAYNRLVKRPWRASNEAMWRSDHLYDVVVVIGFNDAPVVPGKGSAIFLHVASADYAPTAGCVALALPDLLSALPVIAPDTKIEISV